jgi:hypothetical protein
MKSPCDILLKALADDGWEATFAQTENENRKRHPHVPVRTVALEPEQQVGRAAAGKAFRSEHGLAQCCLQPIVPG